MLTKIDYMKRKKQELVFENNLLKQSLTDLVKNFKIFLIFFQKIHYEEEKIILQEEEDLNINE